MVKKIRTNPAFYATLFPTLRGIATNYGYALSVHGSLLNDFDLIAVPWEDEIGSYINMLVEMTNTIQGILYYYYPIKVDGERVYVPLQYPQLYTGLEKEFKIPHGRENYCIQLSQEVYIDMTIVISKMHQPILTNKNN